MPTSYVQLTQDDWDTLHNPLVALADTFPGADAGLQIAAAIASLPEGVGGTVDATRWRTAQNCTGFLIPPGVRVLLGPISFTLFAHGPPITVQNGGRLVGAGCNSPGATTLRAGRGLNKPVMQCGSSSGWWQHGEVRNLRIDGQRQWNTAGHGLWIVGLGETSLVQRLNIFNCAEAGLSLSGSHSGTGSIENVTVNNCGTYGIHLDQFRSGITLKCVGGDANPITLGITGATQGGGPVTVIDLKSEGTREADPDPTILITGGSGDGKVNLTLVGGNCVTPHTGRTLLRIAADVRSDPAIQIVGLCTAGQTTLIDDQRTGTVVETDHASYHQLFAYCGGKSVRFDHQGWVTRP